MTPVCLVLNRVFTAVAVVGPDARRASEIQDKDEDAYAGEIAAAISKHGGPDTYKGCVFFCSEGAPTGVIGPHGLSCSGPPEQVPQLGSYRPRVT